MKLQKKDQQAAACRPDRNGRSFVSTIQFSFL